MATNRKGPNTSYPLMLRLVLLHSELKSCTIRTLEPIGVDGTNSQVFSSNIKIIGIVTLTKR